MRNEEEVRKDLHYGDEKGYTTKQQSLVVIAEMLLDIRELLRAMNEREERQHPMPFHKAVEE